MYRSFFIAMSLTAVFASVCLADEPDQNEQSVEAAPKTHTVERGELVLEVRSESRLEAGEVTLVRLTPDAYSGAFELVSLNRRIGRVNVGEVLMAFDSEPISEQIRNAEVALVEATERLQFEQQELGMILEANATRVERAEKALADAQVTWELWETFHGDRMLRSADLGTRQRESGVLNQREELAQLQSMYDGAELESATKEIVLDRAMRSLAIAEEWLDITREDERITVDYTHGQRARDLRDEIRYREESLAHTRLQAAIAEARKFRTIQQVTRTHEEAQKRLTQLKNDQKLFVIAAPKAGLLARIDREIGDRVNARQTAAEIHDDATLRLKFNATPNDLRVLRAGLPLTVRIPELPEVVMEGRVEAIETIGRASGKQTHFNVEVRIDQPHQLARIGLQAQVEAMVPMRDVLMVPRKAVTWEEGRAFVNVGEGDDKVRREVTLGASNKDSYQIVDGLSRGDVVYLPEKD